MNSMIKTIIMTPALCFCELATGQERHDLENHATHDVREHHDHSHQGVDSGHSSHYGQNAATGPALTRTEDIESALARGGEPIVADVLGVVCDFCALAMNKIFGRRAEVAAIYVDLDTKALSLVLIPGASMSDQTIADLAILAGYRIAAVRRGEEALGIAS